MVSELWSCRIPAQRNAPAITELQNMGLFPQPSSPKIWGINLDGGSNGAIFPDIAQKLTQISPVLNSCCKMAKT